MLFTLKRMIERIEKARMSFNGFLLTFFSVVFLRNFMESFSDVDNFRTPVSSAAFFLHYPMFYLCLFLVLVFILHALTKGKILNVTKVVFCFSPLILIAPTVDLLYSRGSGLNISYVFGDLPYLVNQYLTYFAGDAGHGVTPGIQVELLVAFLLVGVYVFVKTGTMIKTIAAIIISYTIGFMLGSLPSVVALLWRLTGVETGLAELFAGDVILYHFYSFNHLIALVYIPIIIGEFGLWLFLYDRRKFTAIIRNLRGLRVLHYLCMLGWGMLLGYMRLGSVSLSASPFPVLILLAAGSAGILAWVYAVGVNDLYDLETDKISNSRRPLASGMLNQTEQRTINTISLILSLVSAYVVRYPFFLPILVIIGISYIYSAPPLRLKRIPILATFAIALCSVLMSLGGFVLFSSNYSYAGFPPRILLTMLIAMTVAFGVKDIKDVGGDSITGCKTIPNMLGEKRGKQVVGVLVCLAYLCVPLFLDCLKLLPLTAVFGIATFLFINRRQTRESPIFITYFLFLGVLLLSILNQLHRDPMCLFG